MNKDEDQKGSPDPDEKEIEDILKQRETLNKTLKKLLIKIMEKE